VGAPLRYFLPTLGVHQKNITCREGEGFKESFFACRFQKNRTRQTHVLSPHHRNREPNLHL
jgi:hypothetical protein